MNLQQLKPKWCGTRSQISGLDGDNTGEVVKQSVATFSKDKMKMHSFNEDEVLNAYRKGEKRVPSYSRAM